MKGFWTRTTSEAEEVCDQPHCDYMITAGEEYYRDDESGETWCVTCWSIDTLEDHEKLRG